MGLIKFFSGARVAVATVFLAIALFSLVAGGPFLAAFLAVLVYFGSQEYVSFTKAKGMDPSFRMIILMCFLLLGFAGFGWYQYFGLILTFGIIGSFILIMFRGKSATINDLAATILGFMYGGWLPMHLILLRDINQLGFNIFGKHISDGMGFIVIVFLVITLSDIAAYYVGKKFGKTPLWPEISPKKTMKGSVAGTLGGIFGSVLIGYFIGLPFHHALVAGFLLSLAAQFGDLSESMMKRDAGMKDSGNVLPGHGGVLDRADSYIFTGAVAYYYFSIFVVGNFSLLNLIP